ncbi:MAG: ATP-binding domain-containing protein [Candidatus Binatia bacterium]|nr:ATP-binding domain-containing protein [Candidatus Binatia bacterium]
MPAAIVQEELDILERVNRVLAEPQSDGPSEAALVAELERLREMLQEGEKAEDHAALLQQWDRQNALLQQIRASRSAPQIDPSSPYFGHMRLRENGTERDILLGKATKLHKDVRIVDWRHAPISKIFYRYQQGDEYEEEIAGRNVVGTVVVRRTVTIRDRALQRVEAPEGIFVRENPGSDRWRKITRSRPRLAGGQVSALRAYGAEEQTSRRLGTDSRGLVMRADKHLPDIAGLIDSKQFELITRSSTGFLVIRGTAGSGKTTVALHRIAYLAYEDKTIDSPKTLVVVFSKGLRDYVSHVLPALGVHHVQVHTFADWAAEQVRRLFPKLPRKTRELTPAVVQRLKLHPALLVAVERHLAREQASNIPEQVLDDWASILSHGPLLKQVFDEFAPLAFTEAELQAAVDWCRERCREVIAWAEREFSSDAELDPEDYPLLLFLWQKRLGPLPGPGGHPLLYRHLVIDEVQDFAPLEVRVLLACLDEHQSVTLAGDTQQHILLEGGFTSWAQLFRDLGLEGVEVNTLEISYRCSREIAFFANEVLGPVREEISPPQTTRTGPPVEFFRFTDHGACVNFLAEVLRELAYREPLASVALLTPDPQVSTLYYEGLKTCEVPRVHRVEQENFSFAPGVEVTEVDQVKGLEFDYVILVEVNSTFYPDTPAARRLLHVGATRAIHQLWLTSVATPSPILRPLLDRQGALAEASR